MQVVAAKRNGRSSRRTRGCVRRRRVSRHGSPGVSGTEYGGARCTNRVPLEGGAGKVMVGLWTSG